MEIPIGIGAAPLQRRPRGQSRGDSDGDESDDTQHNDNTSDARVPSALMEAEEVKPGRSDGAHPATKANKAAFL